MRFWILICLLAGALALGPTSPLRGQECASEAAVGNFDVIFEGADFDGVDTQFTYCISGIDGPGFHALSNWELSLDADCLGEADITACSPQPCFYQKQDPNTGITGIKFDEVEVEAGETECFSFSLAGDWSSDLGDVTLGLKAATEVFFGDICGPVCVGCSANLAVLHDDEGERLLSVSVIHNRPPVVQTRVLFKITDGFGQTVHEWRDGPVTLQRGDTYRVLAPIQDLPPLSAGTYKIWMKLKGMSGWILRSSTFVVE